MSRIIALLLLFCAEVVVAPLAASAAPITVPTGLNPGDTYRLAFVTSIWRDSTSSNIADYNAFVTGVANGASELAALGTTWSVIGSTATVAARDNTGTNPFADGTGVPIYRLDGTRIADSNADLWDGSLAASISVTESGDDVVGQAWTGTLVGQPISPLGGAGVAWGIVRAINVQWMFFSVAAPEVPMAFYAISDELTVVPEPSTQYLVWIGATAVIGWQLASRRHRKRQ